MVVSHCLLLKKKKKEKKQIKRLMMRYMYIYLFCCCMLVLYNACLTQCSFSINDVNHALCLSITPFSLLLHDNRIAGNFGGQLILAIW